MFHNLFTEASKQLPLLVLKTRLIQMLQALGIVGVCVLLGACSAAKIRVSDKPLFMQGNDPKAVYPQVPFDAVAAKEALKRGKSRIVGRLCVMSYGTYSGSGETVSLFPVTPYLLAWQELRQRNDINTSWFGGEKAAVYMTPEAIRTRLDVKANQDGVFEFTEMRPGKYYIQGHHTIVQPMQRDVYSHSSTYNYTTTHYYNKEYYNQTMGGLFENFVEIKKDGETKKVILSTMPAKCNVKL